MQNKSGFDNGFIGVYPLAIVPLSSRKCLENVSEKYAKWGYRFLSDFLAKDLFYPSQTVSKGQIGQKRIGKCTFFDFFCTKIWSCQKKAVLLHPLSKKKH